MICARPGAKHREANGLTFLVLLLAKVKRRPLRSNFPLGFQKLVQLILGDCELTCILIFIHVFVLKLVHCNNLNRAFYSPLTARGRIGKQLPLLANGLGFHS